MRELLAAAAVTFTATGLLMLAWWGADRLDRRARNRRIAKRLEKK